MRRFILFIGLCFYALFGHAQINTDRVMAIGRNALYFEDYVLSIQYFNQVIGAKPYLAEPYFYRALAKFYLEDFSGAELDCSESIERNPYMINTYEIRGLSRINKGDYHLAAEDYRQAIYYSPEQFTLYHNLVYCEISDSNLVAATAEVDKMISKWPKMAKAYTLKADVMLKQKDTIQATELLDKALELDPFEGQAWSGRGILSMTQQEYKQAEEQFDKAIHLLPKSGGNYINRALCRFNQNKLDAALKDYDMALDLEPENYVGHYNRALLRAQVGDDNRAIEDFNFVLKRDPEDYLALYNRAQLLEQTGDFKAAIQDYTTVIDHFPDFWTGILARAECRRKMGDIRGAEKDEFTVTKAQLDKRYSGRKGQFVKTRKRSDKDLENYNSLVVEDETEMERKYSNDYRGRIQDRKVDIELLPMFVLTYYERPSEVKRTIHYYEPIDLMTSSHQLSQRLIITKDEMPLDQKMVESQFESLNRYSERIVQDAGGPEHQAVMLFARALDYYLVQDLDNALADLNLSVEADGRKFGAYFNRAMVRYKLLQIKKAQDAEQAAENTSISAALGGKVERKLDVNQMMEYNNIRLDLDRVIQLEPEFIYGYYNRGNMSMETGDYRAALLDYDKALQLDKEFAEAYYNRGICYIQLGKISEGVADLSKAGESGLYSAYNLIKRYADNK